jgi:predicted negative regulator of RcsB-dependent stress response
MSPKPSAKQAIPAPAEPVEALPTPLEAFLDAHFKKIAYAALAVVVVLAVYGIVNYRANQAAEQAAMEATSAKTIDDCAIVATKYKGTVAAGNALLAKAKMEWDQTKKDSAVTTLRSFVKEYSDHPFYVQGLLALASRLEAMGNKEASEAQGLYEQIVKDHKDSEIAGLAQMRLGDLLWAQGKEDEAKKIYDEMPRKFPGQFFEENQKRLDLIAAVLPTKEVDAPKIPDALKAPAPAAPGAPTGAAPAINLTPGKGGLGVSQPFEVKATPAAPAGAPKAGAKAPAATPSPVKVEAKPAPAPAPATPAAPIKVEAKPGTPPTTVAPPAPPAPKIQAPAPAPSAPVTPPAPAPTPAPEAKK